MSRCIEAPNHGIAKRRLVKIVGRQAGKLICHKCGNGLCYNPNHVYFGTKSTNAIDKVKHSGGNKLTHGQVQVIKYLRRRGYTLEQLGWMFDATPTMISRIVRGKAWNHGCI